MWKSRVSPGAQVFAGFAVGWLLGDTVYEVKGEWQQRAQIKADFGGPLAKNAWMVSLCVVQQGARLPRDQRWRFVVLRRARQRGVEPVRSTPARMLREGQPVDRNEVHMIQGGTGCRTQDGLAAVANQVMAEQSTRNLRGTAGASKTP